MTSTSFRFTVLVLVAAGLAVAALDAQQSSSAPVHPIGRVRTLITVELMSDGSANVIDSRSVRNTLDATKLVEELAAEHAIDAANATGRTADGKPGQCEGITQAGQRCKMKALSGSRFCRYHQPNQ